MTMMTTILDNFRGVEEILERRAQAASIPNDEATAEVVFDTPAKSDRVVDVTDELIDELHMRQHMEWLIEDIDGVHQTTSNIQVGSRTTIKCGKTGLTCKMREENPTISEKDRIRVFVSDSALLIHQYTNVHTKYQQYFSMVKQSYVVAGVYHCPYPDYSETWKTFRRLRVHCEKAAVGEDGNLKAAIVAVGWTDKDFTRGSILTAISRACSDMTLPEQHQNWQLAGQAEPA